MQVRVTFGWPALREKVFCAASGLDDVTVELLKISLVRGLDHSPLGDDVELRLTSVDNDKLILTWVNSSNERPVESIEVPRRLYDEIAADVQGYQDLRTQLTAGPFVDFHRLLIDAETASAPSS